MKIIELAMLSALISISSSSFYTNYQNIISKIDAHKEKIRLIGIIENSDVIEFDLDGKKLVSDNKLINLNDKFSYTSLNMSNKFVRSKNGPNFNRGFTIIIKYKKKELEKISYNTANGLNIPILSDKL